MKKSYQLSHKNTILLMIVAIQYIFLESHNVLVICYNANIIRNEDRKRGIPQKNINYQKVLKYH